MIVIGVDPGYHRIGFSVIKETEGKFKLLFSECYSTSKDLSFSERIAMVTERFRELCEKYSPEICGIEKIFMNTNQKTVMQIAEVRGAIIYASHQHNIHTRQYTPIEIKKVLTGQGTADKLQVEKMVKIILPDAPENKIDDEYDAIAVALACLLNDKN